MQLSFGQFIGRVHSDARSSGFACAEYRHASTTRLPVHTHADPHFVLVLSGDYLTEARTVGHLRNAAPLLIYNPPGVTHRDQFRSQTGAFFTVSVEAEHASLLADSGLVRGDAHMLADAELIRTMLRMRHEVECADAFSAVVLEGLGLELLGGTARYIHSSSHARSAPRWLDLALDLMRERCCDALTIREVAAAVGVHSFHLARVTRAHLGVSPGELLRRFRIARAAQLLTSTDRPLSDVALTCGYADQSQFTRSFRRTLGTTPGAYRQRTRST